MDTHKMLYDQDFSAWAQHQATLIRQDTWRDIDRAHVAEEIAVMAHGRIVELGAAEKVLGSPEHEVTRCLLAAARRPTNTANMPVKP